MVEQGRESGRLGRAVARGEAASPADLVVRLPEACEGEAASRQIWGCGWAAAEGEAASPADLRVRLGGGGGQGREAGRFRGCG